MDHVEEICISYDVKSRSIAFYNVATKNRIRYNAQNYHHLPNVMKHIDEVKPLIHWPRYCHPLRVFISDIRFLNKTGTLRAEKDLELEMRLFWENLWTRW